MEPRAPNKFVNFRNAEILLVQLAMVIVLIFSLMDLLYDLRSDSPTMHIVIDVLLTSVLLMALGILFYRTKRTHGIMAKLELDFFQVKKDIERSEQEKQLLLKGLGEAIDRQLSVWNLSEAEKEIALLLLKGLSHKEIAAMRGTSERTARQQSLSIYSKAQLKGRSDLAAYFIEDLLAPVEETPRGHHSKPAGQMPSETTH